MYCGNASHRMSVVKLRHHPTVMLSELGSSKGQSHAVEASHTSLQLPQALTGVLMGEPELHQPADEPSSRLVIPNRAPIPVRNPLSRCILSRPSLDRRWSDAGKGEARPRRFPHPFPGHPSHRFCQFSTSIVTAASAASPGSLIFECRPHPNQG